MSTTPTVSFTVRRPTPVSRQSSSGPESDREPSFKVPALPRHLSTGSGRSRPQSPLVKESTARNGRSYSRHDDSSDEEEETVDEIVTGFDQFGVQRLHEKKKEGPLVIPALANRDWRELARKRKASEIFVPERARAKTGADGSVGGLGTRDEINSAPQVIGLVKAEKKMKMEIDDDAQSSNEGGSDVAPEKVETEDERAMRALIARANGEEIGDGGLTIDAIPLTGDRLSRPLTEADAYKQDVVTRPDSASLNDYERVPVSEFGAALLRGMGWKPGQAASRTRTGPVEPYLPTARPALLGIGAKEREVLDDGSGKNGKSKGPFRPDKKYIPVVKRERERDSASAPSSRRASRSPSPDRRRDRDRDRDGDRDYDRRREKDRRDYASDYDTDKRDRTKDRHRESDSDRNRDRRRDDREYDRRDRGGERDKERDRDRRR